MTFLGAAQSVTASMHLVEVGGRKILLDCGRVPGPRSTFRRRNVQFPFVPHTIDAVILSHAHLDHYGNLPHLVRQGFLGPIYCTPATRDLIALMLGDSARHQEEDARVLRILDQEEEAEVSSLVSREDVGHAVRQCVPVPYEQPQRVFPEVTLRFADAGHLLGSAMVALTIGHGGRDYRLTFTGDLGRRGLPLVRDPAPVPEAHLLVCECTYGGRTHHSLEQVVRTLGEVVRRTVERGGKVLIPAFTLGRTQMVVCCLREAMKAGGFPEVPIYIDSPLAADVVAVYRRHLECLKPETSRRLQQGDDPFDGPGVEYVRTVEQSKELAGRRGPCIIVAASAMCDAGRILRHLKENIDDPRCTVVLVSYQGARKPGPTPAGASADGPLSRPQLERLGRRRGPGWIFRPRRSQRLP